MRIAFVFAFLFFLVICLSDVECKSKKPKSTSSHKSTGKGSQRHTIVKHHHTSQHRHDDSSEEKKDVHKKIKTGAYEQSSFLEHERKDSTSSGRRNATRISGRHRGRNSSSLPGHSKDHYKNQGRSNITLTSLHSHSNFSLSNNGNQNRNVSSLLGHHFEQRNKTSSQSLFNRNITHPSNLHLNINNTNFLSGLGFEQRNKSSSHNSFNLTQPNNFQPNISYTNIRNKHNLRNSTTLNIKSSHTRNELNKSSNNITSKAPSSGSDIDPHKIDGNPKYGWIYPTTSKPSYGWNFNNARQFEEDYKKQFIDSNGKVIPIAHSFDQPIKSFGSNPFAVTFNPHNPQPMTMTKTYPNIGWNINLQKPMTAQTYQPVISSHFSPPSSQVGWTYTPVYSQPKFNHFDNFDSGYLYFSKKDKKKKKKKFDLSLEDWSLEDLSIDKDELKDILKDASKNFSDKLKKLHEKKLLAKLPTRRLYSLLFPKVKQRLNLEPLSGKGNLPKFNSTSYTGYYPVPSNPKIFAGLEGINNNIDLARKKRELSHESQETIKNLRAFFNSEKGFENGVTHENKSVSNAIFLKHELDNNLYKENRNFRSTWKHNATNIRSKRELSPQGKATARLINKFLANERDCNDTVLDARRKRHSEGITISRVLNRDISEEPVLQNFKFGKVDALVLGGIEVSVYGGIPKTLPFQKPSDKDTSKSKEVDTNSFYDDDTPFTDKRRGLSSNIAKKALGQTTSKSKERNEDSGFSQNSLPEVKVNRDRTIIPYAQKLLVNSKRIEDDSDKPTFKEHSTSNNNLKTNASGLRDKKVTKLMPIRESIQEFLKKRPNVPTKLSIVNESIENWIESQKSKLNVTSKNDKSHRIKRSPLSENITILSVSMNKNYTYPFNASSINPNNSLVQLGENFAENSNVSLTDFFYVDRNMENSTIEVKDDYFTEDVSNHDETLLQVKTHIEKNVSSNNLETTEVTSKSVFMETPKFETKELFSTYPVRLIDSYDKTSRNNNIAPDIVSPEEGTSEMVFISTFSKPDKDRFSDKTSTTTQSSSIVYQESAQSEQKELQIEDSVSSLQPMVRSPSYPTSPWVLHAPTLKILGIHEKAEGLHLHNVSVSDIFSESKLDARPSIIQVPERKVYCPSGHRYLRGRCRVVWGW